MSWDLHLQCKECVHECDRVVDLGNYTHNTNSMIRAASMAPKEYKNLPSVAGEVLFREKTEGKCWGDMEGKTGKQVSRFCTKIIKELERNSRKYIKMNPDNDWGSYGTVLEFIKEVKSGCDENPELKFHASG